MQNRKKRETKAVPRSAPTDVSLFAPFAFLHALFMTEAR